MVQKYNPSASFSNAMFDSGKKTKREKKLIKKFPYKDFDRDGVPNILDCSPYNKNKDVWYDPRTWFPSKPTVPQLGAPIIKPSEAAQVPTGVVPTGTGGVISQIPTGTIGGGRIGAPEIGGITPIVQPTLFEQVTPTKIDEKKLVAEVKKEEEARKLGLGVSVVSAYQPLTKTQQAEQKRLELSREIIKFKEEPIKKIAEYGKKALTGIWGVLSYPTTVIEETLSKSEYEKLKKGVVEEYKYEPYPMQKTLETTNIYEMTEEQKKSLVFGYPQYAVEEKSQKITRDLITKSKEISDVEYIKYTTKQSEIQASLNDERITFEKADEMNKQAFENFEKSYDKKFTLIYNQKKSEVEKYGQDISKKYAFLQSLTLLPVYAGMGYGLGVVGGVSTVAGYSIAGLGTASVLINLPEITAPILQKDIYTLGTLGVTTAAFIGGGYFGAKLGSGIKAKYVEEPKINNAIKNSRTVTTYKDLTKISQLNEIIVDVNGKKYLQNQLDKGFTLRQYTSKLVSENPATSKYLPNVQGKYIEVLGRNMEVLERINLGKVLVDYKGKTYSRNVIENAVGKIEGDTVKYYSRNLITETTGKMKPVQYLEFFEEMKLTKIEKEKFGRKLTGEAKISLLKEVEKPKLADITKMERLGPPTPENVGKIFENLVAGKPYGKADIFYKQKIRKAQIKIYKEQGEDFTRFLIGTKTIETGEGVAVFKRTYPKVKPVKVSKFFIEEPKIKPTKYPSQKPYAPQKLEMPEPLRMEAYIKTFLGKQYPSQVYGALTYEAAKGLTPEMALGITTNKFTRFLIGKPVTKVETKISAITKVELTQKQIQLQKQQQMQMNKLNLSLLGGQALQTKTQLKEELQLRTEQLRQQKLQQQQQQKLQQRLQSILGFQTITPTRPVKPIKPFVPFVFMPYYKPSPKEIRKIKAQEKKRQKEIRKYQASVPFL